MCAKQQQKTLLAPALHVGGATIKPTSGARNLGVFFDSHLDLKQHFSNICWSCYFQLRQLHVVRRLLSPGVLLTLLHSFVSCRLDYCNFIRRTADMWYTAICSQLRSLMHISSVLHFLFSAAILYAILNISANNIFPNCPNISKWLAYQTQLLVKIWCFYHKMNNSSDMLSRYWESCSNEWTRSESLDFSCWFTNMHRIALWCHWRFTHRIHWLLGVIFIYPDNIVISVWWH